MSKRPLLDRLFAHDFSIPQRTRVACALTAALLPGAQSTAAAAQTCAPGVPVAFIGANVLSMSDSILRPVRAVLVEAGRISAIGNPAIPANACRIEASGMVLLPGLADMHAHMGEEDLPLFLSNGVTLVRELNGSPTHLALRARINGGKIVGPRLFVGSPLLTGKPLQYRHRLIANAQEAYAAAREYKQAGYDFLKIYDDLSAESYEAFVAAGLTLGLPLDGHIPKSVGLSGVLNAKQNIQHMDKIVYALGANTADSALAEARRLFTGRNVWVTPTLASLKAMDIAGTAAYGERFKRAEMAYVDSSTLGWWRSLVGSGTKPPGISRYYALEMALLPVLRSTGVRFLVGTDASNPMMIAGFSVHEELETLVRDGGFTRYQALLAATRDAAEFLNEPLNGQVRVGARADLLLVNGNPLNDLATLQHSVGVMVNGRWIDRNALNAALPSVIKSAVPK